LDVEVNTRCHKEAVVSIKQFLRTEVLAGWFGSGAAYFDRYRQHRFGPPQFEAPPVPRTWWQQPGIGIQYQIEFRPGGRRRLPHDGEQMA
jgi:hypothetical protein